MSHHRHRGACGDAQIDSRERRARAIVHRHAAELDLAFRLAEDHGIVLLNGGGFEAPDWSLRVSLANLGDDVYEDIGRGVRSIARGYRDAYEASNGRAEDVSERDKSALPVGH